MYSLDIMVKMLTVHSINQFLIKQTFGRPKGAAIAQWIRLCLPNCSPGFEFQDTIYVFMVKYFTTHICHGVEKRTKSNKKRPGFGPHLKNRS